MNMRRALSPLVATVLLIAFAVAFGTIIMEWSLNLISPDDPCSDVQLEFFQAANGGVCFQASTKTVRLVIENNGEVDVEQLRIDLWDKLLDQTNFTKDVKLESGSSGTINIQYSPPSTDKITVRILPIIRSGDDLLSCPDKKLEKSNIPVC